MSLKASAAGLVAIRQSIACTEWSATDDRWLVAASFDLKPKQEWYQGGPFAYGCSETTWGRFLGGRIEIRDDTFQAFCRVLNLNWEVIAERISACSTVIDWGTAGDVSLFYGRAEECAQLEQWISTDRRLIALLGMGGVGKTTLAVKLAQQVQTQFSFVIWRSLRDAPPLNRLLKEMVLFLSNQQEMQGTPELFIDYLQQARCLVILDNLETVLEPGQAGRFRAKYRGYGDLLKEVGTRVHQSCVMVTSRECPEGIAALEFERSHVQVLRVEGSPEVAQAILQDNSLVGTAEEKTAVGNQVSHNPLAVQLLATSIRDLFDGNISAFLTQNTVVFNGVHKLLDEQFNRLSGMEKSILYWLAINREWTPLTELQTDIVPGASKPRLLEALEAVLGRSLLEQKGGQYTLQPMVMEYVTGQLIEQMAVMLAQHGEPEGSMDEALSFIVSSTVLQRYSTASASLFHRHALVKATAKDFIRQAQVRVILTPLVDLLRMLHTDDRIKLKLTCLLDAMRASQLNEREASVYGSGNVINLLRHLDTDFTGYDFSGLTIRYAELQGIELQGVNFRNATLIRSVFSETMGGVYSVSFNPTGTVMVTGDTTGEIRLWNVAEDRVEAAYQVHDGWVTAAIFSPDSTILATSGNQVVKLWDANTGASRGVLQGHTGWVRSIAFNRDGTRLVSSGAEDHSVRVWDVNTQHCLCVLHHGAPTFGCAFSPEGDRVVSCGGDQQVKVWDVDTEACLETFTGHANQVFAVAFSPDGSLLLSASADDVMHLWDLETGECLFTVQGWTGAFHPNGRELASASCIDYAVRLWHVQTGQCGKVMSGHTAMVWQVQYSPDGQTVASVSHDQTIRLWDAETGDCRRILRGYTQQVLSVAYSETDKPKIDSMLLASGHSDGGVRIWDLSAQSRHLHLKGNTTNLRSPVAFVGDCADSPHDLLVATGGSDYNVKLWNSNTGQCIRTLSGHTNAILAIAFDQKRGILATGGADHTVRLWNIQTGKCLEILHGHTQWITDATFNTNQEATGIDIEPILATCSYDHTIKLWTIEGNCIGTLEGHTNWVYGVAFVPTRTPNEFLLVSGASDKTVKVWNVQTRECLRTLNGHTDWVMNVAVSPDGTTVASTSTDQTIRLWNLHTGECLNTLHGHSAWVLAVAFSPDGQTVVSGSEDETIKIWDVATGECLSTLRACKPYEGMDITGVTGLSEAQQMALESLGAVTVT